MPAKLSKNHYPALRIIATWNKIVGIVVGVILLFIGIIQLFGADDKSSAIWLIVGAVVIAIFSIAIAESILLFLDIEENTRKSANHLEQLVNLTKQRDAKASRTPHPGHPGPKKNTATPRKATAEQTKTIVDLIHSLHHDGLSFEDIAQELRSEGIPTLDGKSYWTADAVAAVLNSR